MNAQRTAWMRTIAGAGFALTLALTGCGSAASSSTSGGSAASSSASSQDAVSNADSSNASTSATQEQASVWVMTKATQKSIDEFTDPTGKAFTYEIISNADFSYDDHGNVTTTVTDVTAKDGSVDKTTNTKTTITSTYDDDGNVLTTSAEYTSTEEGDSSGKYAETYTYEKDSAGRVTAKHCERDGIKDFSTATYEYDGSGKLTKETNTTKLMNAGSDSQPSGERVTSITYGANGLPESQTISTTGTNESQNSESKATLSYEFDDKGRVSKKTLNYEDGTVSESTYTWDENGNMATESLQFIVNGSKGTSYESTYEWKQVSDPSTAARDHYAQVCMITE